jgi:hypothetical protein
MSFAGLYLGWAAIGHSITGWWAFDWLDTSKAGSEEAVTAYCLGFVLLAPMSTSPAPTCIWVLTAAVYTLMQGFVGIRESLTRSLQAFQTAAATQEALDS